MAYKGKFRPQNYKKYKGDPTNIVYRSGWELKFMKYLDRQPEVLRWSSEEVIIPYRSPIDNRLHRYYPDFWVKTTKGESLIEIKPKKQTKPPKPNPKHKRRYLKEVKTWGINEAKWKAAQEFCENKGWKWQIITEDILNNTK
tara:strand:- start:2641 stop:3066 length:426 start_codon:yes stop_codon:yes gene_type:complete